MKKKVILEINRNLELMKVKPLIVEANIPPWREVIYSILQNITQRRGRNIKLQDLNNITNPFNIKTALHDIYIPYEDKLQLISKVLFNDINNIDFVEEIFTEIVDTLKLEYATDFDFLINQIATSTPSPNFKPQYITKIINDVLRNNGVGIKAPYGLEKLDILYNFLYIFYKKESFENINFINPRDDFYEFLLKQIKNKEEGHTILGFKNEPTINELKNKFPNLRELFNNDNIKPPLKLEMLKQFTKLTDKEIAKKLNLLIKEYSSDIEGTGFKKVLNDYIINKSNPIELLKTITSNPKLYNDLNIQDSNKLIALIEYFPIFIKEGEIGYKSYRYIDKFINGLKQSIPGIKKINFAHGLILQNQKRINESATAELSSLFIKCTNELNPQNRDAILAKYRPQVQRLYKGYFISVKNNIYDNIIKPLNELKASKESIDPETINELISGIKADDPKIGINIYLEFLEESKKSNILGTKEKNVYYELLKSIVPSTIKTNEIPKTLIGKFFNYFNKNPYVSTLLFGPGVNLKLLTNCILFYKKRFRNPKSSKAVTYIYMYLTYLMMNSFYKAILTVVQPVMGTLFTIGGVYLDKGTQDFIKAVYKRITGNETNYEGFISDNIENVLYKDNETFLTIKNIFIYEFKKYLTTSFVGFADNQANKSFSKILGQNWYQPLLPPIITNFESGLAFRTFVRFYNYANDKELQNFKQVLWDSTKDIWNILVNTNTEEIEKEIKREGEISNVKTVKLTYEVKTSPLRIYVPDFTYDYIKTIEHNGSNIKTYVRKDPTRGIIIYNFGETDASKIVITSTRNTNKYVLKK